MPSLIEWEDRKWQNMVDFRQQYIDSPWVIGGDFNVIRSLDEYSGSSVKDQLARTEFNDCIETCGLMAMLPIGEEYTWGGTRSTGWVCKNLDRVLFTKEWHDLFPSSSVENLSRPSSDHCPILHLVAPQNANDLINFSRGLKRSMRELNSFLITYELASVQKVNRQKSAFMVAENCSTRRIVVIHQTLGIQKGSLPFTYLGCRLYYALPIHVFSAIPPPKFVLREMERKCQRFLWSGPEGTTRKHWRSWERLTFPVSENGLGLRDFQGDIDALTVKLWWKLKQKKGPWSRLFLASYEFLFQEEDDLLVWQLNPQGYGYAISGEGGVFIYGESGYLGGADSFMAERNNYQVSHIYWEVNVVADRLSKIASSGVSEMFSTLALLPRYVKGLLVLDQLSFPYVCSKSREHNPWIRVVTGLKGGTLVLEFDEMGNMCTLLGILVVWEDWVQVATCFRGVTSVCEGSIAAMEVENDTNIIWKSAWHALVVYDDWGGRTEGSNHAVALEERRLIEWLLLSFISVSSSFV
ncbi:OLC1v1031613C1 [Oldenlandia corymbosa var. corymbosa]|uniref:OLC1v1031613C1 n=1 Tax=Oldenlandia corymbosa var. corymbosa TaxID=529605 RepID=A0AAV1CIW3_OLDCO|nr:OLC1v1031613C1 [Oldenlandia corymbosa var. corymbosa]